MSESRGTTARGPVPRGGALLLMLVAAVACGLSITAFHYRLRALSLAGRDLGFFVAEYDHLLERAPWRGLAVQPNGNNAFGFAGVDGHPTLHHDIHFSPLKYALALVHGATGSVLVVQLVLVAILLAAIAYVLARARTTASVDRFAPLAWSAVALSPPFVTASCHDLRPSIALGAFVAALAAALLSRAPRSHVALLAGLGLSIREDAAILLALAALWLELDGRPRDARPLYALVVLYVASFHTLYFGVLPFQYEPSARTFAVWVALGLHPALLGTSRHLRARIARMHRAHRAATALVLALPFTLPWLPLLVGHHAVRGAAARSFPALLVALVAGTHAILTASAAQTRRRATVFAACAVVPALTASLVMIDDTRDRAERAAPVWRIANELPRGTTVLTDFAHYQAFAGRDRLLVWERLPAALDPTESREFPASRPTLVRVLHELDGLVIVSEPSYRTLARTMRDAGSELERCDLHAFDLVVARRRGGRTACP